MKNVVIETGTTEDEKALRKNIELFEANLQKQRAALAEIEASKAQIQKAWIAKLQACRTPEDFEALGFELNCDYSAPGDESKGKFNGGCEYGRVSEYWRRLQLRLPTKAPTHSVGDWAYNFIAKENQKIVSVTWDQGFGKWRYGLPGLSTPDVSSPFEGAPSVEYVTDNSYSYRRA